MPLPSMQLQPEADVVAATRMTSRRPLLNPLNGFWGDHHDAGKSRIMMMTPTTVQCSMRTNVAHNSIFLVAATRKIKIGGPPPPTTRAPMAKASGTHGWLGTLFIRLHGRHRQRSRRRRALFPVSGDIDGVLSRRRFWSSFFS